jgi:EpsI family protein
VVRDYYESPNDKGFSAELAVIAGHKKRSIHTPAFCMVGGGFETLTQESYTLQLADGKQIPVARSIMEGHNKERNQDWQEVVTYFFTDGDFCTPSLVRFQIAQFFARFQSTIPMGATVRIRVPIRGDDVVGAKKLSDAFARATVPGVLAALRQARLNPR